MVRGLAARTTPEPTPGKWSVYVLRCVDRSLYTGITNDLERRVDQHNKGRGARYTRSHRPVTLVYRENGFSRSGALVREAEIKSWPRTRKLQLMADTSAPRRSSKIHERPRKRLRKRIH